MNKPMIERGRLGIGHNIRFESVSCNCKCDELCSYVISIILSVKPNFLLVKPYPSIIPLNQHTRTHEEPVGRTKIMCNFSVWGETSTANNRKAFLP